MNEQDHDSDADKWESGELGGDDERVAHLSPEELESDKRMIAEMLAEYGKGQK